MNRPPGRHWLRSFSPAVVACEGCAADMIPDGAEVQAALAEEGKKWSWTSWRNKCPHIR